ncbi:MAG TPA: AAA family ATPase [Chitinophagaceae bacterium]|nr:AAA family ATPase [Chitinophagaceae bacterium]
METKLVTLGAMIAKVDSEPPMNFIWQGIKEQTLNFIVAPPKVGKTTLCENMGLSVAAGKSEFLGWPLWFGDNRKCLMISCEEFYKNRTSRNQRQVQALQSELGSGEWQANFMVSSDEAPRYISNKTDWKWLEDEILLYSPRLTILDSLSRLHPGQSIEDSTVCIDLTKRLNTIVDKTGTTFIVIHHTHKTNGLPLTLTNMAGSRILGQEAGAIIGLNKTPRGKRYMKPLAYRYADDHVEKVMLFKINPDGWITPQGFQDEGILLRDFDNRTDDSNYVVFTNFVQSFESSEDPIEIKTGNFMANLVGKGKMSNVTLYKQIDRAIEEGLLEDCGKGKYRVANLK